MFSVKFIFPFSVILTSENLTPHLEMGTTLEALKFDLSTLLNAKETQLCVENKFVSNKFQM